MSLKRIIALLVIMLIFNIKATKGQTLVDDYLHTSANTVHTPEVASMKRYGVKNLMSSTGQMTYSVPIYNISINNFNWPISLNYLYGGLMLEGKPSLNGLGWQLIANASINKQARGLPDGTPNGYYGINNINEKINNIISDYYDDVDLDVAGDCPVHTPFDKTTYEEIREFIDGKWDSEVDIYTANIGGETFSFKIFKNEIGELEHYFLSKHGNKISEINRDTSEYFAVSSFVITDNKGVKYFFDANDRERIIVDPDEEITEDKTSAWLLSKIEVSNNKLIEFYYHKNEYTSWDYKAGAAATYYVTSEGVEGDIVEQPSYGEEISTSEMSRGILDSIVFPKGKICFSSINKNGRILYDEIVIKDKSNIPINTYTFDYLGDRDKLIEIQNNDRLLNKFDYYGNTIPSFINSTTDYPHAQDFWGYYNGKPNNRSINIKYSSDIVDKTPSFYKTRLGALKRITYPTKGYSEINYELNNIKTINTGAVNGEPVLNKELLVQLNPKTDNNQREIVIEHTFLMPTIADISHVIDGDLLNNYFSLEIIRLDGSQCQTYNNCYSTPVNSLPAMNYYEKANYLRAHVVPGDGTLTCEYYPHPIFCPTYISPITGPDDYETSYYFESNDSGGYIYISPGTYRFKITTIPDEGGEPLFTNGEIYGEIRVRYYENLENNEEFYYNKAIGGLRVSNITDYNANNKKVKSTKYDYNDDSRFSSGVLQSKPLYNYSYIFNVIHSSIPISHTLKVFDLRPFSTIKDYSGIPVYYKSIRTINVDKQNRKNGSILNIYKAPSVIENEQPRIPKTKNLNKTNISSTYIYNTSDQQKKQDIYKYSVIQNQIDNDLCFHCDADIKHPLSFKLFIKPVLFSNYDVYSYSIPPEFGSPNDIAIKSHYGIKLYKEVHQNELVRKKITFIDGDILNEENYDAFNYSVDYSYDDYKNVQEINTVSSDGKTKKQQYDYCYENTDDPQYQLMLDKNQTNTAIKERNYINNKLISQAKIGFSIHDGRLLPSRFFTAKDGDDLEEKLKYSYDSYGNIIQVESKEDVTGIESFLWGYNHLYPIAKIKGATLNDVFSVLGFTYEEMQHKEGQELIDIFISLRQNLPNAHITSYTYKPLVGIKSITDRRGETLYYEYDDDNRLKIIRDKEGNIINENEYKYINQTE